MSVVIETTIGDITVDLFIKERPKTCLNFLKLCKTKYYNLCPFHLIGRDFIAQTGDPTGSGSGGQSIFCALYGENGRFFEAETKPKIKHNRLGLISMVNNGEGLHGSQFFFTLNQHLDYLDGIHTVFGHVVEGIDVIIKLNETISDSEMRPYQDILITHTVILDDPFPDPKGLEIPPKSPEVSEELLKSNRIGVSEEIDDMDGKTSEQIEEEMREKEARERALVLEMIGDIPDADVKPPENVLFVCKLNPVTREDDLEVIFSRFGHILSCEVIRDSKTNESLQYAFIEFEKAEDCEKAYFKMDNVLIDDRRIHVDFSQSVSKIKWYGKGKGVTYVNDYKEDKRNPKDKFTIKESAFGQRLDSKYDYVYDNSHDRSDRKKDSDYRSRDKYRPHQRSNKSRSRSRDRERKSRYHTNEKESHHKSKGHHKRSRHSSSPERKSSSHSRHHNKSRRH